MRTSIVLILFIAVWPSYRVQGADPPQGDSSIIPAGAALETLWEAGTFTEGPVAGPDGMIYFSDIGAGGTGRLMSFDPRTRKVEVHCNDSGQSNGLAFDREGTLVACCGPDGGRRALCLVRDDGTLEELVGTFEGHRLNGPNDLIVHPNGFIYFSDPKYGKDNNWELDHSSVYHFDRKSRSLQRLKTDIGKPNGVEVSPDESTLYVAETDDDTGRMTLNSYPILADGSLGQRTRLIDFGSALGVDGMAVDEKGHIYAAVLHKTGIVIYDAQGKELGLIPTPAMPTNCGFGGAAQADDDDVERRTLYITAGKGLYRIVLGIPGHRSVTANP